MGSMTVRALTLLVWSVAAGSAVFWGLRLFVATAPVPAHALAAPPFLDAKADLGRLLGTAPATPVATTVTAPVVAVAGFDTSRLKLLGVVLPGSASDAGALAAAPPGGPAFALIAIEGRPARAFRLGEEVDAGQVLQRLETRRVEIGPAAEPAAAVLSLPEDAPPSRALPAPPRAALSRPSLAVRPPASAAAPVRRSRSAER